MSKTLTGPIANAIAFLSDEAEQRREAGSDMSDYADEPRLISEGLEALDPRLIDGARGLLIALKDLLGDAPHRWDDGTGHCRYCGRDNRGYETEPCIDDCPGEIARAAIAKATGEA